MLIQSRGSVFLHLTKDHFGQTVVDPEAEPEAVAEPSGAKRKR